MASGTLNNNNWTIVTHIEKEDCNYTYKGINARRNGNVIQVTIDGLIDLPANTSSVICTLPPEYSISHHSLSFDLIGITNNGTFENPRIIRAFLNTSREFSLYNYGSLFSNFNSEYSVIFVVD